LSASPAQASKYIVSMLTLQISLTAVQALEIADMLIKSRSMDVVVVDSVAALVPKAELEGDMGQPTMGAQARLMSQALRKLTSSLGHSRTVLIFINQIRNKIGVMYERASKQDGTMVWHTKTLSQLFLGLAIQRLRAEEMRSNSTPRSVLISAAYVHTYKMPL
jgi:protein RecA